MSWTVILKRGAQNILNVFNTSDPVRHATREWQNTITSGNALHMNQIRKDIVSYLEPRLKEILMEKVEETDESRNEQEIAATRYLARFLRVNFTGLKEAERSKFDVTIHNVLMRHPEWRVEGKSPAYSTYTKMEK